METNAPMILESNILEKLETNAPMIVGNLFIARVVIICCYITSHYTASYNDWGVIFREDTHHQRELLFGKGS